MEQFTMNIPTLAVLAGLLVGVILGHMHLISMVKSLTEHQIALGEMVKSSALNTVLKENHFDLQARSIQDFMEEFLGKEFNAQCVYRKGVKPRYELFIWKKYDARDMGPVFHGSTPSEILSGFMKAYYSQEYFVNAEAFPK